MTDDVDGLSMTHLPLYQSLTEHPLFAGAPKSVLLVLAVVSILFIVNFNFFYILLITLPLYFLCVYLAQSDAQFFDCYSNYVTKDSYYST
ncbi:VirB3 family type IV secretion system protein [uncultured Mitsuokella sp.]|uniref:VirB3 family type IV secretion system protein n=1 Tax=uncultured Mitsuokella sp. TaxID=453120 RepID=UPI002611D81D|nr:VirB3 family type IV secretion system protein [uncultured Mitsuokella sp.]